MVPGRATFWQSTQGATFSCLLFLLSRLDDERTPDNASAEKGRQGEGTPLSLGTAKIINQTNYSRSLKVTFEKLKKKSKRSLKSWIKLPNRGKVFYNIFCIKYIFLYWKFICLSLMALCVPFYKWLAWWHRLAGTMRCRKKDDAQKFKAGINTAEGSYLSWSYIGGLNFMNQFLLIYLGHNERRGAIYRYLKFSTEEPF